MTAVGEWDVAKAPYTTNGYRWAIVTHKGQERIWMITHAFVYAFNKDPEGTLEKMWDSPMSFDLDWSVFEDPEQDERQYMAELYARNGMVSELYVTGQAEQRLVEVEVNPI